MLVPARLIAALRCRGHLSIHCAFHSRCGGAIVQRLAAPHRPCQRARGWLWRRPPAVAARLPACRSGSWSPTRGRGAPARPGRPRRRRAGGWRTSGAGCGADRRRRGPPARRRPAATVQALCRDSRPPRWLRKSAGVPRPLAAKRRPAPDEVAPRRPGGIRAEGDDPLLAPLAEQPHRPLRPRGRRRRRRAPPPPRSAPRRRTAPPAARGRAATPGVSPTQAAASSRSTSSTLIALGSRYGGRGGRTAPAGSVPVSPSSSEEPVEPAHGHQGPCGRGGRQRRVLGAALAQVARNSATSGSATAAGSVTPRPWRYAGSARGRAGRRGGCCRATPRSIRRWSSQPRDRSARGGRRRPAQRLRSGRGPRPPAAAGMPCASATGP